MLATFQTPLRKALHSFAFVSAVWVTSAIAETKDIRGEVETFLSTYCYDCHDDVSEKGDLNLLDLEFEIEDPGNFETWRAVHDAISYGDMPPENKKQPKSDEKGEFLTTIKKPLLEADREARKVFGRVQTRRLTRREYEHTLHDLLGIDIPLQEYLPEDPTLHGFETVADVQQISHFNLAAYLSAADAALEEAFRRTEKENKIYSRELTAKQLGTEYDRGAGNYRGPDFRDEQSITWPMGPQFYGRMYSTRVPESGWYRVTLKGVNAINPRDGVVWGTLRSGFCSSNAPMMFPVGLVEATPRKRDLVFEAWIQEGHNLELKPNDVTYKRATNGATGGRVSYKGRDLKKEGFQGIAVSGIKMERIYPNADRDRIIQNVFAGVDWKGRKEGKSNREVIAPAVKRFANRAFRRPVSQEHVDPWIDLAVEEMKEPGATINDGLHAAYRGILCSPRFLTFVEKPGKLDDYALANRLSYMVWNSMPDWPLRHAADQGKLTSDPEELHRQLDRLLNHPKSDRFIASLADQWLTLNLIDFTTPDRRRFRTFDLIVQDSMVQETQTFLKELILKDQSIKKLIMADHTYVNERLARFYGLKDIDLTPGEGLQRVKLPNPYSGGLVSQGSIMKVTADGTVTSPILRGIWMGERILGLHIPPPPPGVPAVEPDIRGAVSIRDQLAKHSNNESCAACHRKIDPAGFAFENYDPVGLWRTGYAAGNKGAKVDPSGVTPDGKAFKGIQGWKTIYAGRPEMLAKAFGENLLTYATGAPPRFSDKWDIQQIANRTKDDNYGMRSIVHAVVATEAFQSK
ncbi:MAG: DUF1592 domain-containing protein [Verrucomicrobiales bacterium]|nr:DUF1592 domain-containing protein [Verrucomicrobiales bacterium]